MTPNKHILWLECESSIAKLDNYYGTGKKIGLRWYHEITLSNLSKYQHLF